MPNQVNDPPSPQRSIQTTTAANQAARVGPYTDASLTTRNAEETAAASDLPPGSGSTTTGGIRPVYANDQLPETENVAAEGDNVDVDPPPHAPNKWARGTDANGNRISRDPYRNNGMVGQTYLENQG